MLDHFIGRPYRADACGPEAFDCKGLVRAVQRAVWGRDVPPLADARAALRDAAAAGWAPTDAAPEPGDVLLVHAVDGPHVGVFVRAGRRLLVLHARSRIVRGMQAGRVELHALADLLACGYARPQVWRHGA
jgi:cell wall-associated NlpC family hydrolase